MSLDPEYKLTYYNVPPFNDSTYLVLRDSIPVSKLEYGDLIAGVEHYTAYYYRVVDDTLYTIGFENPVTLMKHKPPLLTIPFPFSYGEEAICDYNSKGLYSSKEPVKTEGNIQLQADAYGKMVLPSGDTLGNVLRIRSLQTIIDADTTITEDQSKLNMECETFRWYSKGYRYPVFEATRIFNLDDTTKAEIFATSFFFHPLEHLYLEQDSANLAVLDSLWNIGTPKEPENNGEEGGLPPLNLVYNYFPNPVRDILYIEFHFDFAAPVTIGLYDINGLPIQLINKGELPAGFHREEINCSMLLPARSYLIRLSVRDEVVGGAVMKR